MATTKKYNLEGKEKGSIKIEAPFEGARAHSQSIKDYITAIRKNARQWSASTKTRSEVKHTTKKPWKQKGTGRARQGSLVSPQFRGGGIVFGPKPKFDMHVRINQKERKAAIRYLISLKIKENKLIVLENTHLEAPSTKTVSNFLKSVGLGRRVLFLGEGEKRDIEVDEKTKKSVSVRTIKHANFSKSVRNLPKAQFTLATNISGYDIMVADTMVVTEAALDEIKQWLA